LEVPSEPTSLSFFVSLCRELGNEELLNSLLSQLGEAQSLEVYIARYSPSGDGDFWDSADLEFVASHFYEISTTDFERFPIDSLRQILSHSSLKLISEDTFSVFLNIFDLTQSN
jgi:hypothetical protein